MNKHKCVKCDGSGVTNKSGIMNVIKDGEPYAIKHCPSCNGGWVAIGVEEIVCDKCFKTLCIAGDVMCYESRTAGTTTIYRPLSDAEVEELLIESKFWMDDIPKRQWLNALLAELKDMPYDVDFKGQPCRLIPWRDDAKTKKESG